MDLNPNLLFGRSIQTKATLSSRRPTSATSTRPSSPSFRAALRSQKVCTCLRTRMTTPSAFPVKDTEDCYLLFSFCLLGCQLVIALRGATWNPHFAFNIFPKHMNIKVCVFNAGEVSEAKRGLKQGFPKTCKDISVPCICRCSFI